MDGIEKAAEYAAGAAKSDVRAERIVEIENEQSLAALETMMRGVK